MKNSFHPLQHEVDRNDAAFLISTFCFYRGPSAHMRSAIGTFCAWLTAPGPAICIGLLGRGRHTSRDAGRILRHGGSERRTVVATSLAGAGRFGGHRLAGGWLYLVARRANSGSFVRPAGRHRRGARIPRLRLAEPPKDGRLRGWPEKTGGR